MPEIRNNPSPPTSYLGYASKLFLALYVAFLAVWLVVQPIPPLQDFEEWVYQGWIGAHLQTGLPGLSDAFAFVHYPVPNELAQTLLMMLERIFPALMAARVFIILLIVAMAAVSYVATRRLRVGNASLMPLLFFLCFFLNSNFWNGYVGYQLGLLILLCWLMLQDRIGPLGVGCFAVVLCTCHASILLAFVIAVTMRVICRQSTWKHLAALAPSIGLLLWYVLVRDKSKAEANLKEQLYSGMLKHLEYKVYTFSKLGPFQNLIDIRHESLATRGHTLYLLGIAINFCFAAFFALGLTLPLRRALTAGWKNPLVLSGFVLLAGFAALSSSTLGVVNLGERFLYPALLFLLFAAGGLEYKRSLTCFGVLGIGLTVWQLMTIPAAKPQSPLSYSVSHEFNVANKYKTYGLYTHELFVGDDRRVFLEHPSNRPFPELLFDTSMIREK